MQRMRDFQRIAQTHDDFEVGHELLPERQGQARAGVFPTPPRLPCKFVEHRLRALAQRAEASLLAPLVRPLRRTIPAATQLQQDLVSQLDEALVLPETILIVRRGWFQVRVLPEMQTAH